MGKDTSCSNETKKLLLMRSLIQESIIGKSIKYNIQSDAPKFERSVDINSQELVLKFIK